MGKRRGVAAAGAALVLALGGTACGGHGGSGGDAAPLTQRQLERAEVPAGALPGWLGHPVKEPPPAAAKASKAACQPLYAQVRGLGAVRQPVRAVAAETFLTPDDAPRPRDVDVVLRAYTGSDARQLMAELRASLKDCRGDFTSPLTYPAPGLTYSGVQRLPDPEAGDEAVAYRIVETMPRIPGEDAKDRALDATHFHVVVVRCGGTVATFTEEADSDQQPEVPAALVTAQADRLRSAAADA